MAAFSHVLENRQNKHVACKTVTHVTHLLKMRIGEQVAPTNPLSAIHKRRTDN